MAVREDTCSRCGEPNPLSWHAPSPLWNAVMRRELPEIAFCCPTCFVIVAQERGIDGEWHLSMHGDISAMFPDPQGRRRNAKTCLWELPSSGLRRWLMFAAICMVFSHSWSGWAPVLYSDCEVRGCGRCEDREYRCGRGC